MQDFQDYNRDKIFELVKSVSKRKLKIKEFVELIKFFTKDPENIRKIIEDSINQGLIKRNGSEIIILKRNKRVRIIKERCNDYCRRCNRKIVNCHYVMLHNLTLGPYGSECVKKFFI